jgi:hypothetical protein
MKIDLAIPRRKDNEMFGASYIDDRIIPEPNTGCWLWLGAINGRSGYGSAKHPALRKNVSAHRISYEIHFGRAPEELGVLHRCDQPSCVNPDHLFLGTQQDNITDMLRKQRGRFQLARSI